MTIKEIAEMANVARSTVSRVLNDSGYVSQDVRERVENIIEETGYVPSEPAVSLRTKKTKVIGVILPTIQTETPSRIVTGLGKKLEQQGYQLLLANTNLNIDKELEYLELLRIRQVDGIILIATNTKPEVIQKIKDINIPVVVVGQDISGVMCVTYDDYHVARDLTSFLIEKGHRNIGFIGVSEVDQAVGYLRKKGFYDEMAAHHLDIEGSWVQEGIFDIDSGYHAMERILAAPDNCPTATIAVTDRLAIGAISYLKQHGIHCPDDMAMTGIGASELSEYIDPPLTTVDYKNEEAGTVAAKQLLARIRSEEVTEKMVLDYRFIYRNSV